LYHALRRLRPGILPLAACALVLLVQRPAGATPAFARQYKMECRSCHTQFPQLNETGRRFRLNNYRFADQKGRAPLAWERGIPVSFQARAHLGWTENGDSEYEDRLDDFQLLASGLFTRRDSFYVHHHIFQNERWGDLLEAFVQHSFPGRLHANLRFGQYEQPLAFSPEKQLLTYSEYLIYDTEVGLNDFLFGPGVRGLMLDLGSLGNGTRLTFSIHQPRRAISHGHEHGDEDPHEGGDGHGDGDGDGDDHGHGFRPRGEGGEPGEGDHLEALSTHPKFGSLLRIQHQFREGRRAGVFGYAGRTQIVTEDGRFNDDFYRWGFDAEALAGKWRLYGLWMTGRHSSPSGSGRDGTLRGGFVGADYSVNPRLIAHTRYDRANARGPLSEGLNQQLVVGVSAVPLKRVQSWRLLGEYQRAQGGRNGFFLATRLAF
jgi:hypothetical protein